MDISMGIGFLCLIGAIGGLVFVGWKSEGKSLRRQFEELPPPAETPQDVTRRTQI